MPFGIISRNHIRYLYFRVFEILGHFVTLALCLHLYRTGIGPTGIVSEFSCIPDKDLLKLHPASKSYLTHPYPSRGKDKNRNSSPV